MKNKIIFIAEAGVNHNGSIKLAKKLIDKASDAGADFIKFQTYIVNNIVRENTPKTNYQTLNTEANEDQYSMLKKLQLNKSDHFNLIQYSKKKKIKFLSSAFDIESLKFLNQLKLNTFKIPSGEITNIPYLEQVGRFNKETILSTGMSNMIEVETALRVLISSGLKKSKITILQCNTDYPSPIEDSNINVISEFKKRFKVKVGYSDHTLGFESALAAVALGADIIEKHFTLDKGLEGPDHKASISPDELKELIILLHNVKKALGSSKKMITKSEKKNVNLVRKKIYSSRLIRKGERFSTKNLKTLRAPRGISAAEWYKYIGKKSDRYYLENQEIKKLTN